MSEPLDEHHVRRMELTIARGREERIVRDYLERTLFYHERIVRYSHQLGRLDERIGD